MWRKCQGKEARRPLSVRQRHVKGEAAIETSLEHTWAIECILRASDIQEGLARDMQSTIKSICR